MTPEDKRFLAVQAIGERYAQAILRLFAGDPSNGRDWHAYPARSWRTVQLLTWIGPGTQGALARVYRDPRDGVKRIALNGMFPEDAARIIRQRAHEWATAELIDGIGAARAAKAKARLLPQEVPNVAS